MTVFVFSEWTGKEGVRLVDACLFGEQDSGGGGGGAVAVLLQRVRKWIVARAGFHISHFTFHMRSDSDFPSFKK